jgi:hypothetical protein
MSIYKLFSGLTLLLLLNCASTNEVIYDYNIETDFNQYDTYVLCVEDFFVEYSNYPNLDNQSIRNYLGDAVDIEMKNTGHKTNVLNPQLQAGFRLVISEETVEFENCEQSEQLEYWENCTIQQATYKHETLIVYVADFNTNKILWHASIPCNLNKPKKKLKPYIDKLVKDLFATYPKNLIYQNPDDFKEN